MIQPELQNLLIPIPELTGNSLADIFVFGFGSVSISMSVIIILRTCIRAIKQEPFKLFLFQVISQLPYYVFWYTSAFLIEMLFQSKVLDYVTFFVIAIHWSYVLSKIETIVDTVGFFSSMEIIAEVKRDK